MSAHATLPITRRFADVRRTDRCVPVGRTGNLGRLRTFREGHRAVGPQPRFLGEGAEVARDGQARPSRLGTEVFGGERFRGTEYVC